jgi:hypothetical protein
VRSWIRLAIWIALLILTPIVIIQFLNDPIVSQPDKMLRLVGVAWWVPIWVVLYLRRRFRADDRSPKPN